MNANQIITETLREMALSTLEMDGEGEDRSLSESIPLPLANELAGRLRGQGLTVSVSTDDTDREKAWVWIDEPRKSRVRSWETVDSYNSQFPGGSCETLVQIGSDSGAWFLRTRDDAGGSDDCDDTAHDSREVAETAAKAFALANDEPDDAVIPPTPDPRGGWCCYWSTVGSESGPRGRYTTEDDAQTAVEIANEALHAANPGGQLLCGFEVRQFVDGEWISQEE